MDDIVAVEVKLKDGESRYFLTWGRIQDRVNPAPLEALILWTADQWVLEGEAVVARVLTSVGLASGEPAFYECFFAMAQRQISFGDSYETWRKRTAEAMEAGDEIWYLGHFALKGEGQT